MSLGYCSISRDINLFVNFLSENFLDTEPIVDSEKCSQMKIMKHQYFKITGIFIYPIKSCAPMRITHSWPIKSNLDGFVYDRNWIIVDSNNIPLTQKRFPNLVKIMPFIHLDSNTLKLTFENEVFDLNLNSTNLSDINVYIYPNNIRGFDEGDQVNFWLKTKLNLSDSCHLVRISNKNVENNSSFYNKESYLLVNERSVSKLNTFAKLDSEEKLVVQFRPNIVVQMLSEDISSDGLLFEEEFWTRLNILNKNIEFKISDKCNRCQMVNINQLAEKSSKELSLLKDL